MDYISYMRRMIGNKPMFMIGSGTLIFNTRGELLLIKRTDNKVWGIPGGSCELGETLEDTAVREAYEETGLKIKKPELFNVFSGENMHHIYPNGDEVYMVVCIFTATDYSGEISADEVESSDVRFFKLKKLPEDLHPPDKFILRRYIKSREETL